MKTVRCTANPFDHRRANERPTSRRPSLVLVAATTLLLGGCAQQAAHPTGPNAMAAPAANQAIPSGSPLAKVREGMGMREVTSLIGEPTDTNSHVTGKAFIPFYFGEDRAQTVAYYKGLGRVTYSIANGSPRVSHVEYDPSETGYSR